MIWPFRLDVRPDDWPAADEPQEPRPGRPQADRGISFDIAIIPHHSRPAGCAWGRLISGCQASTAGFATGDLMRSNFNAPRRSAGGFTVALLLVVAAILIAVIQQMEGVRLVCPWKADDGAFAVQGLHGFRDAIAQGELLPHWIDIGNGG